MFILVDVPVGCYLVALVIAVIAWKSLKWDIGLLLGYLFLVLCATLFIREPFNGIHFQSEPLWSWKEWDTQKGQIIANIVMFFPIGFLLGKRYGWRGIAYAFGVSAAIEVLQLMTQRGLCEFDDVFHNTLGAGIGTAVSEILICLREKKEKHNEYSIYGSGKKN